MRQVKKMALPACIASRLAARPKLSHLARSFNAAGLIPSSVFMHSFDRVTDEIVAKFKLSLDSEEREQVDKLLSDAQAAYATAWNCSVSGAAMSSPVS